jgi:hypothetical protein
MSIREAYPMDIRGSGKVLTLMSNGMSLVTQPPTPSAKYGWNRPAIRAVIGPEPGLCLVVLDLPILKLGALSTLTKSVAAIRSVTLLGGTPEDDVASVTRHQTGTDFVVATYPLFQAFRSRHSQNPGEAALCDVARHLARLRVSPGDNIAQVMGTGVRPPDFQLTRIITSVVCPPHGNATASCITFQNFNISQK